MNRHTPLTCALIVLGGGAPAAFGDTTCVSGTNPLPDGVGAVTRAILVAPSPSTVIVSISLQVQVSHSWIGDLRLVLTDPAGAEVVLLDRPGLPSVGFPGPWGCGGRDIDATFVDGAIQAAESMCSTTAEPVIVGLVAPLEQLATFVGHAPGGTWTLTASDLAPIDTGSLGSVCLILGTAPDCNSNGVADSQDIASGASADRDLDGVPDECECSGDLDGSGHVSGADLAIVLSAWGECPGCAGDVTGDGLVDGSDLAVVLGGWGPCGG